MLRKFNNLRSLGDNIKLGALTAFSAGMVNVASFVILFSFTSNVTGTYAILASEIAKGNLFQIGIVLLWISLFFTGSFLSNLIVIHLSRYNQYVAHAMPLILEAIMISGVGLYGDYYYREKLLETEILTSILLLAMGLQNGLTASISNFAVKTTHLTGTTTDLAIMAAMFTKEEFRRNAELRGKAKLLSAILGAYVTGAVCSGFLSLVAGFKVFYAVGLFLIIVTFYDFYKLRIGALIKTSQKPFVDLPDT
jgi:uncharacterized membrane protein YoaK (UPF0700 family)